MEFVVGLFSKYSFEVAISILVGAACWFLIKYILADHKRDREEWINNQNNLHKEISGQIKTLSKKIDILIKKAGKK